MSNHDRDLASAFDSQAAKFEVAPVQSDPAAIGRLVAFAGLPEGSRVLDAGCGPGLVSEAFLSAGHTVYGVDLSAEMVRRARLRCERFGSRATFDQRSLHDPIPGAPYDAVVSRYVLHHVVDPLGFVRRQFDLLRPGGVLVLSDHTTDPGPVQAEQHERFERDRDITHTRNLTAGGLVDLLTVAGLVDLAMVEESFVLDFDEWFDRGTPAAAKTDVRARLLTGPPVRGFRAAEQPDGSVRIDCVRALLRGIKPS
jgi:SAM-dependent methyltransferase